MADDRAKLYVLVGRNARRQEAGFPHPGTGPGELSIGGAAPSRHWRWCADRLDGVPPVQSSLDSLGALPVLSRCFGSTGFVTSPRNVTSNQSYISPPEG